MPKFIVKEVITEEIFYEVEADSKEKAIEHCKDLNPETDSIRTDSYHCWFDIVSTSSLKNNEPPPLPLICLYLLLKSWIEKTKK